MSGGHWNYGHYRLRDTLDDVANDGQIVRRFPKLAQVFHDFGPLLSNIIHELDYDLSGDSGIENDVDFEIKALDKLARALKTQYAVRIYQDVEWSEDDLPK